MNSPDISLIKSRDFELEATKIFVEDEDDEDEF
jgi:hypothetical protein